jgi:ribonuclease E
MERERYGRGGGGGINRYPDVSGRDRTGSADRPPERQPSRGGGRPDQGPGRQERFDRPAPRSGDPWSEVPPELEEMLRAQLAQSPKIRRPQPSPEALTSAPAESPTEVAPTRRTVTRRKAEPTAFEPVTDVAASGGPAVETTAPKRRAATRRKPETAGNESAPQADAAAAAAPKRRTSTRKKAEAGEPAAAASGDDAGVSAPKRRTTRKKAEPA